MRWRVRKLPPDRWPRSTRRWVSEPVIGDLMRRFHATHREALDRAIRKAYGR